MKNEPILVILGIQNPEETWLAAGNW